MKERETSRESESEKVRKRVGEGGRGSRRSSDGERESERDPPEYPGGRDQLSVERLR